jgi:hypothetical protein
LIVIDLLPQSTGIYIFYNAAIVSIFLLNLGAAAHASFLDSLGESGLYLVISRYSWTPSKERKSTIQRFRTEFLLQVVLGLGNRPKGEKKLYLLSFIVFGA